MITIIEMQESVVMGPNQGGGIRAVCSVNGRKVIVPVSQEVGQAIVGLNNAVMEKLYSMQRNDPVQGGGFQGHPPEGYPHPVHDINPQRQQAQQSGRRSQRPQNSGTVKPISAAQYEKAQAVLKKRYEAGLQKQAQAEYEAEQEYIRQQQAAQEAAFHAAQNGQPMGGQTMQDMFNANNQQPLEEGTSYQGYLEAENEVEEPIYIQTQEAFDPAGTQFVDEEFTY